MTSYEATSYANTTAAACFALQPWQAQVACSSQQLNITDPPSIYSWDLFSYLWQPVTCLLSNVTYNNRVDVPASYNWCSVPLRGSDAFLFVSLALLAAICLFGKLSAVWVLVAGAALGTLNYYVNLLQISNSISLWLGISPPDIFFYAFLPPLIVEASMALDFFMFSKLWVHIILNAFVMVVLSTIMLSPLILFVLGFAGRGFNWVHCAVFSAMIASTDAVSTTAILKQGGGPEKLIVMLEGEALLNDASAITLYTVFMNFLGDMAGSNIAPSVWSAIPTILRDIAKLSAIGAGVGLGMGVATGYLLRWLRWRGAKTSVELTGVLAIAYLAYYVAQSPSMGSGVIAVAVYGLWGNYTSHWGMLSATEESGAFEAFWDTVAFASNGIVFFWSGISAINFLIRSTVTLGTSAWSYAAIPLIYIFMVIIRTGCIGAFNVSFFAWIRERLSLPEVLFTGWSGLRGSVSLIILADFINKSQQGDGSNADDQPGGIDQVSSTIAIWTASFVFLTLIINAPSISYLMHWLKLDRITPEKQVMRSNAKRALLRFTDAAIASLKEDDDELMQGANWEAVAQYVDVSGALRKFDPPPPPPGAGGVTVVVAPGEGDNGGSGDGGGGEGKAADTPLARKSIVHSVTQALLAPLAPFVAAGGGGGGGETDGGGGAGFETDVSQRSRRRAMGLFRASSAAAGLGRTTSATKERSGRSRRRRHRRHNAAGRAFAGGAGFSSDGSSDSELDESDASGNSSDSSSRVGRSLGSSPRGSLFADDGDADSLVEEALEECPFIQGGAGTYAQPSQSQLDEKGAPPPVPPPANIAGGKGDVELGLRGDVMSGGGRESAVFPQAPPPRPSPPLVPADADDALMAEHASFIRLQRQLRQQQSRPTLGSLFSSQADEAQPSAGGGRSSGSFVRVGSLQSIKEGLQQDDAWDQGARPSPQMESSAAPPSYYSSLPAAAGRQLAAQLKRERLQQLSTAEQGPPAGVAPDPEGPAYHAAYYSSMPAAVGRQMAEQLKREAMKAPAAEGSTANSSGSRDGVQPRLSTQPSDGEDTLQPLGYYSSVPAAVGRQLAQQLRHEQAAAATPGQEQRQQHDEIQPELGAEPVHAAASYSTVPASMGRTLQRRLAEQLGQQPLLEGPPSDHTIASLQRNFSSAKDVLQAPSPQPIGPNASTQAGNQGPLSQQASAAAGLLAMPPRPGMRTPRTAQLKPGWEAYHRTVSGAAGSSLAAELQRQLAQAKGAPAALTSPAGPLTARPQRDLLGRRLQRPASSSDVFGAAARAHQRPLSKGSSPRAFDMVMPPGVAAAQPAPTPMSVSLHMQRARTMQRAQQAFTADSPSSAAGVVAQLDAGAVHGSVSSGPTRQDRSWQHRPVPVPLAGTQASTPTNPWLAFGPPAINPLPRAASDDGLNRPPSALARFTHASSAGSVGVSSVHGAGAIMESGGNFGPQELAPLPSTAAAPGASNGLSKGLLAEMRSRLIAGIKRYFHAKRMEGLLSSKGLRILEYACDHAAERTHGALSMWRLLEKEVAGNLSTRVMAQSLMLVARSWRASPRWLQVATSWPVKKLSGFLRRLLGQRMLVSCEVAVEYYLAMIHSPQIQWLQQADDAWPLQQEVEGEVDAAYRFIIDREIEAPDRFQAIQSYRAAMAVLRQQLTFVQELYDSGMVDGGEKDDMVAPLDKRMRHLEITGPVWKPPRPRAVLRGLPFMQALPDHMFAAILRAGTIKEYKTGAAFWSSSDLPSLSGLAAGPGAYVVLSGVVRRIHQRPDGTVQEYFQGIGGVIGSLLAITGTRLPGQETAVAEGNTLGKGPMLFHVPQGAVVDVLQRAAGDDPDASLLRLQLLRLAAAYVCESCEQDVTNAMYLHLVQLAAAKAQRLLRRRSGRVDAGQPSSPLASQRQPRSAMLQRPAASAGNTLQRRDRVAAATPSLARLSARQKRGSGAGAEDAEEEQGGAGLRPSGPAAALHRQTAVPGALHTSKSFGGQLAQLMQQIATEEFEEMGAGDQQEQAGAGYDDRASTSPHPSDGTGHEGSAADLPGLGSGGRAAAESGLGTSLQEPRLSRKSLAAGDSVDHAKPAASAAKAVGKAMRQRVRAAEQRAPQYAVEVLADLKRGLPSGALLELPAGIHFSQTTHVVLLRGQLLAAGPPLASDDSSPSGSPLDSPSVSGGLRSSMELAASGLSMPRGSSALRRASLGAASGGEPDREAWVAEAAAAAASPAAPCLLPWLWNSRYRCSGGARPVLEQLWRAGDSGALLLVCLTDSGEVPSGVGEAETAAEEAAAAAAGEAEAEAAAAASELESHPVDISNSSGSHHLRSDVSARVGSRAAGVKTAARSAWKATGPATQAAAGLMRLMPWQHSTSRSHTTSKGGGDTTRPGAAGEHVPSNSDGPDHGTLRLPLEQLVSRRHDTSGRSFNSAR